MVNSIFSKLKVIDSRYFHTVKKSIPSKEGGSGNDIDDSKCPRPSADPNKRTMGVSECDDGIRHIDRDLGGLERETRCEGEELLLRKSRESSVTQYDDIPETYVPDHICINETIDYKCFGKLPTHGPHRPNWASFGQYRWVECLQTESLFFLISEGEKAIKRQNFHDMT